MMPGFEITSMTLTSCQTYLVRFKSVVLCSQIDLPCCSCSANQTSTQCCLEVTVLVRMSNVSWAVWVSFPLPWHQLGPHHTKISSRHRDVVRTIHRRGSCNQREKM